MKRIPNVLLLIWTLFLCAGASAAQQIPAARANDLSFEKPSGWFEMNGEQRTANFKRFDFTKEELTKLMARESSTTIVAVFVRDDISKTAGITPTIQVVLRPIRGAPSFEQFKTALLRSQTAGTGLDNYTLLGEPETPDISGIRSVLLNSRFNLKHQSEEYVIRARTYAIMRDNYFIQISMSDEDDAGWTEKEFTQFINSVKIVK